MQDGNFRVFLYWFLGLSVAINPLPLVNANEIVVSTGKEVSESYNSRAKYWKIDEKKIPDSVSVRPASSPLQIEKKGDSINWVKGQVIEADFQGNKFKASAQSVTSAPASAVGRNIARSILKGLPYVGDAAFLAGLAVKMAEEDQEYEYDPACLAGSGDIFSLKSGFMSPNCKAFDKNHDIYDLKLEAYKKHHNLTCEKTSVLSGNGDVPHCSGGLSRRLYTKSRYNRPGSYTLTEVCFTPIVCSDFIANNSFDDFTDFDDSPKPVDLSGSQLFEHVINSIDWDTEEAKIGVIKELPDRELMDNLDLLNDTFADDNYGVLKLVDYPSEIKADSVITVSTDSEGNTITTEKSPSLSLSSDSSGNLVADYNIVENNYINGSLIGSSSTSSTDRPSGVGNPAPESVVVEFDFEECRDMPSACSYHDFMQTPASPPPDSDPDFSDLNVDLDSFDNYKINVNLGAGYCPNPKKVDLGVFGEVELTYQFICQHAEDAKPFIVISASLSALFIILGFSRKTE